MRLIDGFGINDANYPVNSTVDGVKVRCKIFERWVSMVQRCYNEKSLSRRPHYRGCSIDVRWSSFMEFRKWMLMQDWEGKQLDKDLLVKGNKVYGPDTCCFINQKLNTSITDTRVKSNGLPIGIHIDRGKYRVEVQSKYVGYFDDLDSALTCYTNTKRDVIRELLKLESDNRVIEAVKERFKL